MRSLLSPVSPQQDGKFWLTVYQDKQLVRAANVAHSMHEVSTQASMYIPIAAPPANLPSHVTIDRNSQWHISALLSVALESMTLPSRLRAVEGMRSSLGQIEAALNINGNQRIADLRFSVVDQESGQKMHSQAGERSGPTDPSLARSNGDLTNTTDRQGQDSSHEATAGLTTFDINLSPSPSQDCGTRPVAKETRVFGQVESFRGDPIQAGQEEEANHGIDARMRNRLAGLPVAERLVILLLFIMEKYDQHQTSREFGRRLACYWMPRYEG